MDLSSPPPGRWRKNVVHGAGLLKQEVPYEDADRHRFIKR